MNLTARILWPCLASLSLTGCGVVTSTSALVDAHGRYQSATAVGAGSVSPYEYTLGVEYLRKAQEEAGNSDYQVAEQLARQAGTYLGQSVRPRRTSESGEDDLEE